MTHRKMLLRYLLSSISLKVLVVLLSTSTLGCSYGRKSPEIEFWLIDHEDMVLYRDIGDGNEQAIPIEGNKDMEKFIVLDRQEYLQYLLDAIERGDKI